MKFQIGPSLRAAALAVVVVSCASGCKWFRSNSDYANSPELRPLSVPPDLDTPPSDPSMQIPQSRTASAAASDAFEVSDAPASTWRRLGLALERIEGVSIEQRAEALNAYNVRYDGEEFLLRVVASGNNSRIEAVGADGAQASSAAAGRLLGMLKARLS